MSVRIKFAGIIYNAGQRIMGYDFSGNPQLGYIIEYYPMGGWYNVRINGYGDTAMIRVETAALV